MRTQVVESAVSASQSVREVMQQLAEEEGGADEATVLVGVQPAESAAAAAQPGERCALAGNLAVFGAQ